MSDQLPPHDDQAEAGCLGCVLLANGQANELIDRLDLSDFYDLRHRTVFGALKRLRDDNAPIDAATLDFRLREVGELDNAGGFQYVAALPDQSPSAANFDFFFEVLQCKPARRSILRDIAELSLLASDPAINHKLLADAARRFGQGYKAGDLTPLRTLQDRQFNFDFNPPPLRAVFTLTGAVISTPGNLTTITSAVKTGKSAVIGAMLSAAMTNDGGRDLLGFVSSNTNGLAVNLFDSEQSPDDFWHGIARAIKRAGLTSPPPWLHAYCLTGLGFKRSQECLRAAVKANAADHGGTHSIHLDGAADFVGDVNDAAESNSLVAELHDTAITYDCPLISVIHLNPGLEKSRGHLGSQLERKAETNLRLDKSDGVTCIWSDKQRRAPIQKDSGPCFAWSDEMGMHVTVESRGETTKKDKRAMLIPVVEDIFGTRPAMKYSDIISAIVSV